MKSYFSQQLYRETKVLLNMYTQNVCTSKYFLYRMTEKIRWQSNLGGLLSIILLKTGPARRSDQFAQDVIQSGLDNPEGCRLHNFSMQPVPPPDCPHGEEVFLWFLCCFSLYPSPLILHHAPRGGAWLCLLNGPSLLIGAGELLVGPSKLSLVQAEQAQLAHLPLTEQVLQPLDSLVALRNLLCFIIFFFLNGRLKTRLRISFLSINTSCHPKSKLLRNKRKCGSFGLCSDTCKLQPIFCEWPS